MIRVRACAASLVTFLVAACTGAPSVSSGPPLSPMPTRSTLTATDITAAIGWAPEPPAGAPEKVFRPESYGARGDGVADDTAALQEAVDAAAGQGRVELAPHATYRMEGALLLPSYSYLHGAGPTSELSFTWTDNDSSHDGLYLGNVDQTSSGNTDITLDNFAIRGAASGLPAGPNMMHDDPKVPGIRFRLVDRFAITRLEVSHVPGISVLHQGSSNGLISDNHVHHSGRDGIHSGWHVRNMYRILVAGNRVEKVGDDALAVVGASGGERNTSALPYDIALVDNVVEGWTANPNGLSLGRGIAVIASTKVTLLHNSIDRTHSYGVMIIGAIRDRQDDPSTGELWRSSDIVVKDNWVYNAGQLYPGSGGDTDDPGHDGILVERTDRVSLVDNTIVNPYGDKVRLDDCRSCS